jgi:hypothetical protein
MLHLSHRPFATHHAGQPSLPRRRRTRPVCEGMPRIPPLEKARLDLPIMDLRRGPITRVSGKPLLDQASRSEWPRLPRVDLPATSDAVSVRPLRGQELSYKSISSFPTAGLSVPRM